MAKHAPAQALQLSAAGGGGGTLGSQWLTSGGYGGGNSWPYAQNVVWQNTSSNATYCAASTALRPS